MKIRALALGLLPFVIIGCVRKKDEDKPLSAAEARSALDEASLASQAQSLTADTIEISTNFTIGQAVESAAHELGNFIRSQLPCAGVSVSGKTLSITYAAKSGNCSYRGHNLSGTSSVSVTRNDTDEVVVDHTWTNLSNGRVTLNGTAHVTWNLRERSRHVVHSSTWTRVSDGRQAQGSGDVTQTVLEGGLVEGIRVDGSRSWSGPRGDWDLGIDGVEMRWIDPVPQTGTYTLRTPYGKTASLSFSRVDADTIRVSVQSKASHFSFDVSSAGAIADAH
jgi:hypothetical protein